ncbi:CD209 antigen-like protein C isoform X2 [Osmerus mordax]|uniref:CD209 antigen-like protein C isoform X2 n=1 Tax=Osmerus mordax TaxID=8014 RepID=UPI003510C474
MFIFYTEPVRTELVGMAVFRGQQMDAEYINTQTPDQAEEKTPKSETGSYRWVIVSFGLLCVLQATLNISLRLAFYKDELEPFSNTTEHRALLLARFNILTRERDDLTRKLCGSTKEWTAFGHSCYFLSTEDKMWNESRLDCRERGAELAVINTREEQEFITRIVVSSWMWIGLTDQQTEGTWIWVDGTPLTTTYWNSGEPNDVNGGEDCAMILRVGWNDFPCGNRLSWICEKPI